jgi:hypothetical protein
MQPTLPNRSPEFIPDAELERLAAKRGRESAEAYLLLELRETRSEGLRAIALRTEDLYTVAISSPKITPNQLAIEH